MSYELDDVGINGGEPAPELVVSGVTSDTRAGPVGWGDILPFEGAFVAPQFALDMLPPSAMAYVDDVSSRQGSPAAFVAVSLLGALAGLVGNGVRIAPKANDLWTVVPTLWCMLVGEASTMKTPAMEAGLMPLRWLQGCLDADHDRQRHASAVDIELAKLLNQELAAQAKIAVRDQNIAEARRILSLRPHIIDHPPVRLEVGDISQSRMVQLLAENPFGLLAVHDELPDFFARLIQRSGAGERAMLLKAAIGSIPHSYDRAGRATIRIAEMTLSVLGGIQPSRLLGIVKDAHGEGADGLLARFQATVWCDPEPGRQGVDRCPNDQAAETVRSTVRDCYDFSRAEPGPKVLRFAAGAQELFDEWSASNLANAAIKQPALQSHLVKSVKTIASLALLIELMIGGRTHVSLAATEAALRWAPFLAGQAERLYASGSPDTAAAQKIVARRRQLPPCFTARDLYRASWQGLGKAAANGGLRVLVDRGYIRGESRSTGGRPTTVYMWNPRLPVAEDTDGFP